MHDVTELEPGTIIVLEGEPWRVLDSRRLAGGDPGLVEATLRSVTSGSMSRRRFRTSDRVEVANLETRELEYLYAAGDLHHFMDTATFEQSAIDAALLGDALQFVRENDTVGVQLLDGRPVGFTLPASVELAVTITGPGTQDVSVSNVFKDATLETGAVIKVPLFVETGARIRVDTRTGQFVKCVS